MKLSLRCDLFAGCIPFVPLPHSGRVIDEEQGACSGTPDLLLRIMSGAAAHNGVIHWPHKPQSRSSPHFSHEGRKGGKTCPASENGVDSAEGGLD